MGLSAMSSELRQLQDPRLGSHRFRLFMGIVGCASLAFAVPEIVIAAAAEVNWALAGLAVLSFAVSLLGFGAALLSRLGYQRVAVYVWSGGTATVLALIPLVASGLLTLVVCGMVFSILVIALFDTARNIKPFVPFVALLTVVGTLVESWATWPRFTASGFWIAIPLGTSVLGVVMIGMLISVFGEILLRALEKSVSYAGRLEQATEEELRHMATHDALTNLPNRILLADRFIQAKARTLRSKQHLALLMLDLDHIKRVNDTLGHGAGDEVLREAAKRLLQGADAFPGDRDAADCADERHEQP